MSNGQRRGMGLGWDNSIMRRLGRSASGIGVGWELGTPPAENRRHWQQTSSNIAKPSQASRGRQEGRKKKRMISAAAGGGK